MGLRFKLGSLPEILAGERILHFKNPLWLVSSSSFPSYRISSPLPPLIQLGLYITEKRLLFVSSFLGIIGQEFDCWFENSSSPPDTEIIKEVNWSRNWLKMPYIEIVSQNSRNIWYRSAQVRIKIYTRQAEYIHKIVSDAILENEFWSK